MGDIIIVGKVTRQIFRKVIRLTTIRKFGRETYLLRYEDTYIVAIAEMEGAHELPRYATGIANELQQVLDLLVKIRFFNEIKPKSAYKYDLRVIERVNEEEAKPEGQNVHPIMVR